MTPSGIAALRTCTRSAAAAAPAAEPAPIRAPIRAPIAVIVSRFPLITETFILREIIELERQGQPVVLVPLIRESPAVMHPEAEPWVKRALYSPFISPAVLLDNLRWLRRSPLRYTTALGRVLLGAARSPACFVRTAALLPKAAYLVERLREAGVQHLHAQFATHPATIALVAAELAGLEFSMTVHAHDIFVQRALLESKLRKARFVRLISEFNRAYLERLYPGLLGERARVIHVGIDPALYTTAPVEPERTPAAAAPLVLLCVAALKPYKGIAVLLDACARLAREGLRFRCDIVGEGPLRRELKLEIRDSALGEIVRLRGALPQAEVASMMAGADALVLPSIVAADGQMEGIPVALMEAMASGLPVIASALSGIPELVRDGVNGLLLPPGDAAALAAAIRRLAAEPQLRRQLGERGRETVGRAFRSDRCTAKLLAELDQVRAPLDPSLARLVRTSLDDAGRSSPAGIRRVHEGRDSRAIELLLASPEGAREVVLKLHHARQGESAAPVMRARREHELLCRLSGHAAAGRADHRQQDGAQPFGPAVGAPRPLAFDQQRAAILMERCPGVPLDQLVRSFRWSPRRADRERLRSAVRAAGAWLRGFHDASAEAGHPEQLLEQIFRRALRELEDCPGIGSARRLGIEQRLLALYAQSDLAALRVVACHGDFWPGNVFIDGDTVSAIDFEGVQTGLQHQDVAYFLAQLEPYLSFPVSRSLRAALRDEFSAGYYRCEPPDAAGFTLCAAAAVITQLARSRRRRRRRALLALLPDWS